MHGPIPRILEPPTAPPVSQFFPGDILAAFQTLGGGIAGGGGASVQVQMTRNNNQLALPLPYSQPWQHQTPRATATKPLRPRCITGGGFHPRKPYPAITFTHHNSGQPQRGFFRPTTPAAPSNGFLARPAPTTGGYRSTNSTPPGAGPMSDSLAINPFLLVSPESQSSYQARRHSMPGTFGGGAVARYYVDLHVGSGSAVQVDNGPEKHIVTGMCQELKKIVDDYYCIIIIVLLNCGRLLLYYYYCIIIAKNMRN